MLAFVLATLDPGLVLPPSTSSELSQTCLAVEKALAKGDKDLAKQEAALLPKRAFVIEWDDSAVPATVRPTLLRVRQAAIGSWERVLGVRPTFGPNADVAFHFSAERPSLDLPPATSKFAFGSGPRLGATIALLRGDDGQSASPAELFNDIGYAIGMYLGLADDPLVGSVMHRDDRHTLRPSGVTVGNIKVAEVILNVADQLRRDVEEGVPVKVASPVLSLSPTNVDAPPVLQGVPIPLEFKVSNKGTAPLTYDLVPDCGCFSQVAPGTVAPGETASLTTTISTIEWMGTQHKGLVLYTNDPDHPNVTIHVAFTSTPASRLYRPEGDTVIVPPGGCTIAVLLTFPNASHMLPTSYEVTGPVNAQTTMEPWDGNAADPEMNEPAKPRQGYRFHIKLPGDLPLGRTPMSLAVQTDDPRFPVLRYDFYLQKGIVSLPDSVFFGDMKAAATQSFRLSRHGKPFQVLGVETNNRCLTATARSVRGQEEYQVDVTYKGGAPEGDFLAVVDVRTDDPKQPKIEVQVTGTVR